MDKPDSVQTDQPADAGSNGPAAGFGRKLALGVLLFWIVVVVLVFVFRYPFIFSQLISGGEDRALLAVVSAELDSGTLTIEFIRSVPDQPAGVFIVAGHLPRHSSSSNSELPNSIGTNRLVFNGKEFEILYEAVDLQLLPGREAGMQIDWQGKERGSITLDISGTFAAEEIVANRAFLVLARTGSDFRTSAILRNR